MADEEEDEVGAWGTGKVVAEASGRDAGWCGGQRERRTWEDGEVGCESWVHARLPSCLLDSTVTQ